MTSFLRAPWCAMLVFKQRHGAVLGFIFIVSLGFAAATAALHPKDFGIFVDNNQDTISFLRTAYQVQLQVTSGHYFPRLSTSDYNGYGYPLFQFYPPLAYFLVGYVSVLFTHNVLTAMAVAVTIGSVASGWFVYGLCRLIGLRAAAALIAAFAFMSYPYFTFAAYRQTPTFLAASINAGVVLCSVLFLLRPSYPRALAVSLSVFVLSMTHVISTLLTAIVGPFLILLIAPLVAADARRKALGFRLLTLGIASVLGLGLAAFEVLPIVLYAHEKLLRISALLSDFSGLMDSSHRVTTIPALLSPRLSDGAHLWPRSVGYFGFQIGLPYVLGFVLFLSSVPFRSVSDRALWGVAGLFVLLVLATTPQAIPLIAQPLGAIQFPFRLLSVAALPGALLLAGAAHALWSNLAARVSMPSDFESPTARAILIIVVGSIIGWSSLASPLEAPLQTSPEFAPPVALARILKEPSSGYSGDYLVNAYRFPAMFPSEPLLGGAQYFLYWHNFLAEAGRSYEIPAFRPTGAERLKISGALLDGVSTPAHVRISVGPDVVFDGTIPERRFALDLPLKETAEPVHSVAYAADASVEKDGRRFFARLDSVTFDGLPEAETARYWDQFPFKESGPPDRRTFTVANPGGSANVFVLPVFAYPMLQEVKINGRGAACRPVERNDLVFCGVNLPAGDNTVSIRFTGMKTANWISLASLLLLILGAAFFSWRSLWGRSTPNRRSAVAAASGRGS